MNRKKVLKKLVLLTAMLFVTFLLAGCGSAGVTSGSIKVQVVEMVDLSESIITNAIVGVESDSTGTGGALHRQLAKANGSGNTFIFEDLPPGVVYQVYVEASGYVNDDIASQGEATGGAPQRATVVNDRAFKTVKVEDGQDYYVKIYMKKNPTPSTGSIEGIVRGVDPNNVANSVILPNATVVLRNSDDSMAFSSKTDNTGYYIISNVPVDAKGYKIQCYAANDQGPTQIYRPLESTGGGENETGNGTNSEIFLVPGDVVRKDIFLEKAVIEATPETGGSITAVVQSNNGLAIDFDTTPMFATLYRDGSPYMTKRVAAGGLIEYSDLPITEGGINYNKLEVHSSFIENSPVTFSGFNATLTNNSKSYAAPAPAEVTLRTGNCNVTVNGSFAGNNLSGAQVQTRISAEGSPSNVLVTLTSTSITSNSASGNGSLTSVPIGKRKVTAVATVTNNGAGGTTALAVTMANNEQEVIIISGTDASASFSFQATKQ